jgi:hypothetical protein
MTARAAVKFGAREGPKCCVRHAIRHGVWFLRDHDKIVMQMTHKCFRDARDGSDNLVKVEQGAYFLINRRANNREESVLLGRCSQ